MKIAIVALLCLAFLTARAGPKYARTTTQDLQLRHQQDEDFLATAPFEPHILMRTHAEIRTEEKEGIESELLHRWRAGDQGAYLPMFEPAKR
jgi:hypothetical protein